MFLFYFFFFFHLSSFLLVHEVFFNRALSFSVPLASFRAHNAIIVSATEYTVPNVLSLMRESSFPDASFQYYNHIRKSSAITTHQRSFLSPLAISLFRMNYAAYFVQWKSTECCAASHMLFWFFRLALSFIC